MPDQPAEDLRPHLNLTAARTLARRNDLTVNVVIPAYNEAATIAAVVGQAQRGLDLLGVAGDVTVAASGCTDDTAALARQAGAAVVDAPRGKGAAILAGVHATTGDVVVLVDGDLVYYGETPLVALLAEPLLTGVADAAISTLYWRPVYPDLVLAWLAPLAGVFLPELLPRVGSTPWSGQRAALRHLWPSDLPAGFTSDLALLLHWNSHAGRMRPVLCDDWLNPERPKPELTGQELELFIDRAVATSRMTAAEAVAVRRWSAHVNKTLTAYRHGVDEPQAFERQAMRSLAELLRTELQAG